MSALRPLCFSLVVSWGALLIATPGARGQDAQAAGDMTLATYEVGDLVVHIPDYSGGPRRAPRGSIGASGRGAYGRGGGMSGGAMGGGMGGGRGGYGGEFGGSGGEFGGMDMDAGGQATSPPSPQVSLDDLRHVIVRTVAPGSWALDGTGQGQIEAIGSTLVVLQTARAHNKIEVLIQQLRGGSLARRSVAVDARWLLLTSDDLELLLPADAHPRQIDRARLEEFTRRPASLRGITNCFSGQSVYLISGTQRNVVSSYIPVVGSVDRPDADEAIVSLRPSEPRILFTQFGGAGEGSSSGSRVGYQPIIVTPNFGVHLEIRPTLIHGENAVIVDLTSTITFPGQEAAGADVARAREEGSRSGPPPVDRLAIDTQELATTLRMPLGEPTLVGGMSYIAPGKDAHGAPAAPAADGPETPQLYLVLEIR